MSAFTLSFTLKQHTPLIHFQHDQEGATLRATEVKPKLDQFIREKFLHLKSIHSHPNKEKFKNIIQKHFPVADDKPISSSYQMRISGDIFKRFLLHSQKTEPVDRDRATLGLPSDIRLDFLDKTSYFADNEKIKNKKWDKVKLGIICKNIVGEIFCFHSEVIELLTVALPNFFCLENFGCRQSKGFGSFTVNSINKTNQVLNANLFLNKLEESIEWVFIKRINSGNEDPQRIVTSINTFYKKLKCFPPHDSAIRDYFEEKEITWEKPFISGELVFDATEKPIDYSNDSDKKYVRALLGLAELHDYQQFDVKIKIKDPSIEIERFQSPILFKVFEGNIFLCARPVPDGMLNKLFEFSRSDDPNSKISIRTPADFQIEDFLDTFLNNH